MRSIIRCRGAAAASNAPRTRPSGFGDVDLNAAAFIRVERQTLRKLPQSGDILFTIQIYLDPLGMIACHAGAPAAGGR